MPNFLYDSGRQKFLEGSISYLTDDIKVCLVKSTYNPDLANDSFYSSVIPYIVSTSKSLKSKTSTGGVAGAASLVFESVPLGNTIKYIVIYKNVGDPTQNPLICLIQDGINLPITSTGGDIKINWDSGPNKIFKL